MTSSQRHSSQRHTILAGQQEFFLQLRRKDTYSEHIEKMLDNLIAEYDQMLQEAGQSGRNKRIHRKEEEDDDVL